MGTELPWQAAAAQLATPRARGFNGSGLTEMRLLGGAGSLGSSPPPARRPSHQARLTMPASKTTVRASNYMTQAHWRWAIRNQWVIITGRVRFRKGGDGKSSDRFWVLDSGLSRLARR